MLLASTPPTLSPPAPNSAAGADVASLPIRARTAAKPSATTSTSPSATTRESLMPATVRAGRSPPKAVFDAISGSPSSASMVANSRLVGSHPMVLKASCSPTACDPVVRAVSVTASICERFWAWTTT